MATFRVDIDVATCGEITPLSTLDYLIGSLIPISLRWITGYAALPAMWAGKSCLLITGLRPSRIILTNRF